VREALLNGRGRPLDSGRNNWGQLFDDGLETIEANCFTIVSNWRAAAGSVSFTSETAALRPMDA
jgi:hypothetical protein